MGRPKQLVELAGKPIAAWSLETFAATPSIDHIVIACEPEERERFEKLRRQYGRGKVSAIVSGGARRQDSVLAALRAVPKDTEMVAVHDGARPFVTEALIVRVLERAKETGGAIAAVPVKDTIKQANDNGAIAKTVARERLWSAQTPQAFGYELLLRAHERAEADGFVGTDDAELVERLGGCAVAIVESTYANLKITTPEDLIIAAQLLQSSEVQPSADLAGKAADR